METGDGLLSRVRVPGGRISADALERLAGWARQWGQPTLELTSRGNVQIRGLTAPADEQLTRALIHGGLAVAPARAEAVRNVLSTPAADCDSTALADPWPIARALDQTLVRHAEFWALPGKFRLLVDGGGVTRLSRQTADLRADAVSTATGMVYRLSLWGTAASATVLGFCEVERVATAMLTLTRCFLALSYGQPAVRMRDVLANKGIAAFQNALGELLPAPTFPSHPEPTSPAPTIIGVQPGWVAAALPFGQLPAEVAGKLVALARRHSQGQLRITPWRQVLLPGAPPRVLEDLQALGLIVDSSDARLSVTACPGAPACHSGSTPTREHALAWAKALPELFDGELAVHVSGCGKGCAHPMASPLTLTADDGLYDLILNDRAHPQRDGSTVLTALTTSAVEPTLKKLSEWLYTQRAGNEPLAEVIRRLDPVQVRQLFRD